MSFTIRGNTVFGPTPKEPSVCFFGFLKPYNQKISYTIASLNSDGSDDISFSASNYFWTTSFDIWVQKSVVQSDGKIIIGGRLSRYSSTTINYIGRLDTDGSLDTSFASGTGCNNDVYSLLIQPDSNVIVGGAFTSYNGNSRNRILRIYSGGTIDPTFTIGTGFNAAIYETKLQSDGKILVGGDFTSYSGISRNRIVRLNTDGSIDDTFNIGTGFNGLVKTIEIQSDGKILVGGYFTTYSGISKNYITRLNSDGSIDNTFNSGLGFSNYLNKIYLQQDGKILVGGGFNYYNNDVSQLRPYLMRLNSDGTQDTSFGTASFGFDNYVSAITQRSDGKIVVGGEFTSYQGNTNNKRGFIILNSNGSIDTSSNVIYGAVTGIYSVLDIQNLGDNKMLISGGFTYFNQAPNSDLMLKTDLSGIKDFNFGKTFISSNSTVYGATILSNNRILICGSFSSYDGVPKGCIVSLNSDGSIDNTFTIGTGFNNIAYTALKQNDNKIIVGGAFISYSGVSKNRIVRLNTDGSIDDTFNIGTGFNSSVTSLKFQSDGKIIVGGNFTTYSGVSKNRIVRLNTDGSIDDTFNIGTGFNNVISYASLIDTQTDGKIIVGGAFTSYNGTARNRIVRLNTDGSIDNSFTIGTGFNGGVTHLKVLPNDKILVCGFFASYNGVVRSALVRLNANGTLDTTFNSGNVGFNTGSPIVYRVAVDRYGRIYVSGTFITYNNTFVYRIMRLNSDGTLDTSFNSGTGFGPRTFQTYDILLLND